MPTIVPRPVPMRMPRTTTPPSPPLLTVRRSSSVSRCLFGAPDPKDTMEFSRLEIRKEQQRLKEKWNFDFEADMPLPGDIEYEPIDDVPECLRRETVSPKKPPQAPPVEDVAQRKITEFMGVTKPSTLSPKQSQRKRKTEVDEVRGGTDPVVKSPRVA